MTQPTYTLLDGEIRHQTHPDTFDLPDLETRQHVPPQHFARLIFAPVSRGPVERMWVKVTQRHADGRYSGTLANQPMGIAANFGDPVTFEPRHIIDTCLPISP